MGKDMNTPDHLVKDDALLIVAQPSDELANVLYVLVARALRESLAK
jgi:hypothetical protein